MNNENTLYIGVRAVKSNGTPLTGAELVEFDNPVDAYLAVYLKLGESQKLGIPLSIIEDAGKTGYVNTNIPLRRVPDDDLEGSLYNFASSLGFRLKHDDFKEFPLFGLDIPSVKEVAGSIEQGRKVKVFVADTPYKVQGWCYLGVQD